MKTELKSRLLGFHLNFWNLVIIFTWLGTKKRHINILIEIVLALVQRLDLIISFILGLLVSASQPSLSPPEIYCSDSRCVFTHSVWRNGGHSHVTYNITYIILTFHVRVKSIGFKRHIVIGYDSMRRNWEWCHCGGSIKSVSFSWNYWLLAEFTLFS